METKSKLWMFLLLFVQWLWTTGAQQGTNSGIIIVDSSGGTINTRLGCSEEFVCSGIGTRINWRRFGIRQDLVNTTTQIIAEEAIPSEGDTTGLLFTFTSRLIFPNVATENAGSYTCTIFYDVPGDFLQPKSITVNLDLARERIAIEPPIEEKNMDTYYVGDTLTVGCPVKTCSEGVTVQFLRNDEIVAQGMPSSTDETVFNMNLPLTLNSAGEYMCRVVTETPSDFITQSFNITGTPMVRPGATTQSPVDTGPSTTPMTGTQTTDTTQSTTTNHAAQLSFSLPTLATLLVVLYTMLRLISS